MGVAASLRGGILVNYNMIHLKHTPLRLNRLSALLEMFKEKIVSLAMIVDSL